MPAARCRSCCIQAPLHALRVRGMLAGMDNLKDFLVKTLPLALFGSILAVAIIGCVLLAIGQNASINKLLIDYGSVLGGVVAGLFTLGGGALAYLSVERQIAATLSAPDIRQITAAIGGLSVLLSHVENKPGELRGFHLVNRLIKEVTDPLQNVDHKLADVVREGIKMAGTSTLRSKVVESINGEIERLGRLQKAIESGTLRRAAINAAIEFDPHNNTP